jgi:hypothetical protein
MSRSYIFFPPQVPPWRVAGLLYLLGMIQKDAIFYLNTRYYPRIRLKILRKARKLLIRYVSNTSLELYRYTNISLKCSQYEQLIRM